MNLRKLITLMTFAIALAFGTAVAAQYEAAPEPEQTDVSQQELQQFAEAQGEISSIQQDFSARLQGVEDPEEAHELQIQANEKMTDAVEDAGLDVESFNRIAMAIQNDPELQQQLTEMLQ
jgi:GTP1/Obg family GTP-binding protein